jgi:DNA-binding MarR family transcriptional regulator
MPIDEPGEQAPASPGAAPAELGPLSAAIVRLSRAHRALASQLMREVGLGPDQGALMMHLWEVGPVRQTALAAHFGKDSASTSRTVQRLEHGGFLRRRTDPTDGRATLVEPTPAGAALQGRVQALWAQLERTVEAGLDDTGRDAALAMLTGLADAVSARLEEEPSRSLADV